MHGGSGRSNTVEWLKGVWSRRKWLALGVLALVAAGAVTVVLSLPNVYRAASTVVVEQPRIDSAAPGDLDTRLQLISQEILSRSRLAALIGRFDLYSRMRRHGTLEGAIVRLRRDIRTEFKALPQPSGFGSTIAFTLSYRGTDPQTVARVANALAAFYLEEDLKIRDRQSSEAVRLLKAQLEEIKADLQEQERALGQFQNQYAGELPQYADANFAALTRLNGELRTAGELRARALERRDELQRRLEAPAPGDAAADPAATRMAKAREELAAMKQRFSDKHPDVIQKKAELALLEQAGPGVPEAAAQAQAGPSRRLRESLGEVEEEIRALKSDEARLRSEIGAYVQRLENAPRRQSSLLAVSRDYQTTRDLYDSVRKRFEQAQLESGGEAGQNAPRFRILDAAVVPSHPVAPNRMVLLFVALAASLALAAAAMAVAEHVDSSFHSADDVRSFTRVPVLASIPLIVTTGDRRLRWARASLATVAMLLVLGFVVHASHRVARNQDALVSVLARS